MVHKTLVTEQKWFKESPLGGPCGRYGHRCVVYEDTMYLNGGYNGKERMKDTFAFNLEKRVWREIENKGEVPSERDCHSAVLYKHYMVIFGGGDGFNWLNDMYMFDIKTETWKKVEPKGQVPSGRAGHSANVYKDKMFVFGGWNGRRTLNCLYCFDFMTGYWTRVETQGVPPQSRDSHTCNLVGDKLIVIGGGDGKQRLNDLHEYDILTNRWRKLSYIGEVNAGRAGHVSVVFDQKIYIFAGGDGSNWLTDVYECDTTCMKWTLIETIGACNEANIAPGCYGLSAVLYKTSMVIFGGGDGKSWHNKIYEFKLGDERRKRETRKNLFHECLNNNLTDIGFVFGDDIPSNMYASMLSKKLEETTPEIKQPKKALKEPSVSSLLSTSTVSRGSMDLNSINFRDFLDFEEALHNSRMDESDL
ncbi:hypothetical protein FDP41_004080 [Naegleria fowleri]|uniref:Uncharacterized protein n=1 Tax=Naegleria fowleri TaxID=5763 RepID=A0A6A5BTS5_NAEFO|nr:uncharacterized protein FDP41_004080 [Naegleria fowleri]KAF0976785.1 hypothetical protein FDP41_004080 [Naegleria fowleri]CAG4715558.1 unnamed protein product [Naegleria fowleri]